MDNVKLVRANLFLYFISYLPKRKPCKFGIAPNSVGIGPVNSFFPRLRNFKLLNCPISVGMVPFNSFAALKIYMYLVVIRKHMILVINIHTQ